MRYALRNQSKIAEHFNSQDYLERIIDSLDEHFRTTSEIEELPSDEPKYTMIIVSDIGHTVNIFVFYVISKTYDVYNLAFKEVIG